VAEDKDKAAQAAENVRLAEGFISDAEFREDLTLRELRYLQALCHLNIALYRQNEIIIGLLSRGEGYRREDV